MKHKGTPGIFDSQFRLDDLAKIGDPLNKLNESIDWDIFKAKLDEWYVRPSKPKAGRPPYDKLVMFKILVLQAIYGLSDDGVEYQIKDRLSFQRFLGLDICDRVPDAKTIWAFRETMKPTEDNKSDRVKEIFDLFHSKLKQKGLILNEGKMVDASIVSAPKPRNNKGEHGAIKEGKIPEGWNEDKEKRDQKDLDARFTKKHHKSYYGYKDHIKADTVTKIIDNYFVTPSAVHDSQPLELLLRKEDKGQQLYGDSAYSGEPCLEIIEKFGMKSQVHEKGHRNHPLTEEQIKSNGIKSKTRVRVEHIFGMITKRSNHCMHIFTKGIERASIKIGMMNLAYNLNRAAYLGKAYGISLSS